jgi:hypothetical protein
MVCSKTDVIRAGLLALRRDAALRSEVKAVSFVRAFTDRLREKYGDDAALEFDTAGETPEIQIGGRVISDVRVRIRRSEALIYVDLLDPVTDVAILNAHVTDEDVHVYLPLEYIRVTGPIPVGTDRDTRHLPDGRTAVTYYDDDGTSKTYVLDRDGKTHLMEATRAEWVG